MWREFTHIVEADTEEVAREVWAGLQDKVQTVAHRESGTRKGLRELLQKQTAELSAVDDELGEDSLQIVYYYIHPTCCTELLSFCLCVCISLLLQVNMSF